MGDTYLKDIKLNHNTAMVTCPFHKNHNEKKPACGVFLEDTNTFKTGSFHCFACGESGNFAKFVGQCFGGDSKLGKEWLFDRYSFTYDEDYCESDLQKIVIDNNPKKFYLNESVLKYYDYYHPYMWERKLSKEIVDKFRVGYDPIREMLTFPVWDEKNNLVMITARSVNSKKFFIDGEKEKPVYLLNYAQISNSPYVIICESQIDALTSWVYGVPAVALIGVGSEHQYEVLNRCPIRNWVLMFDNDEAGRKAAKSFKYHIRKDVMITEVSFPPGKKDINNLTQDEFNNMLKENNLK